MVSHHVFSQLILFALLWLVVIVHLIRPKRPVTAPATPTEEPEPLKPKQPRSHEPKPFEASGCGYYRGQIEPRAAHEFAVHLAT
jgi:hypothetical protein